MNGKVGLIVLVLVHSAIGGTEKPEVIGSLQPIEAAVGDDVILPCHLEPPSDVTNLTVDWKVNVSVVNVSVVNVSVVHVYRNGEDRPDMQDKRFKNRTSLFHEEMTKGNISLKLSSVQLSDEGRYRCFVTKWKDKKGSVNLTVVLKVTERKSNRTEEQDVEKIDIGKIVDIVIVVIGVIGVPLLVGGGVAVGLWAVKRRQSAQQAERSRDAGDSHEMKNLTSQTTETPAASNLTNELPEV